MTNIRGIEMHLHTNEDLSNHIRREQDFFEAEILDYLRDRHPVQKTIIDIGANIGNHTIYFANFMQHTRIVAFEPLLDNFLLLDQNISQYPYTMALNTAIGNGNGWIPFTRNDANMGAGKFDPESEYRVPLHAIDWYEFQDVTLMKIDVEGYEPEVLLGAQDTVQRCHPNILIEDWERVYDKLLPDYELEFAWPHHQTFLYRWKNG